MARVLHVSLAQPLLTATRALIPRVKIFSLGCDFRLLHMVAALPAQRVGACKPCIHRHSLKHGDFHISSAGCPQRTGHRKRIGGAPEEYMGTAHSPLVRRCSKSNATHGDSVLCSTAWQERGLSEAWEHRCAGYDTTRAVRYPASVSGLRQRQAASLGYCETTGIPYLSSLALSVGRARPRNLAA